ncbi:MAG: hypothetical protein ABW199_11480 [Caulobacterales bacterium]
MRFLTLYTPTVMGPPEPDHFEKMSALMQEMSSAGVLVATGGLAKASEQGARVTLNKGDFKVDRTGPFMNSNFLMGAGFAILEGESMEAIMPHVRRFLETAGDGTCEIIRVLDAPPKM